MPHTNLRGDSFEQHVGPQEKKKPETKARTYTRNSHWLERRASGEKNLIARSRNRWTAGALRLTRGTNIHTMWWEQPPRGAARCGANRRRLKYIEGGANTQKLGGNTQRRSAHIQKCGAMTHKRGANTENDVQRERATEHKAQTPRKYREETRALDDEATALERKRNQNFECPGFTPAANYRRPGRLGARANVAGRNPPKPPPDPAFGLLPPAHQRILETSGEN